MPGAPAIDSCHPTDDTDPRQLLRGVLKLCNDCDSCRHLLNEACVFLPELFRLGDQEEATGMAPSESELRGLAELCNLCGICPCPKVPADVMQAKSRYVDQEGLSLAARMLTDVPRLARLCARFPRLAEAVRSSSVIGALLRKSTGIHADRQLPAFPRENFFAWALEKGLTRTTPNASTVAYFVGCTAAYLFPQVAQAFVAILARNDIAVHVPPQDCCGMPHLVEGNRAATLQCTEGNLRHLLAAVKGSATLVSSCPSCGYYLKLLLKDRAHYSEAYQRSVEAGDDEIMLPDAHQPGRQLILKKSVFRNLLKDDGYFSPLEPLQRIGLAGSTLDAGEYLLQLHRAGRLDTRFGALSGAMVYFAPCHQRKQRIGSPYRELLNLIPGIAIEAVGGEMDCCGMGGNFGFKTASHDKFLAIGAPLMAKIRERAPQAVITDCLSCRLQFSHALPYAVFHPLEILALAYQAGTASSSIPSA